MDKKLEARIRRLERLIKNEDVETNRTAKDAIDNIMAELDTLALVADEYDDVFGRTLYKVGRELDLLSQIVKTSMGRGASTSNEIW